MPDIKKDASGDAIARLRPDAVIVATGAVPLVPKLPGVNRGNAVTAWELLAGKVKVGKRAVVLGGGEVGCEVAEFLAEQGKKVTIIEMLDAVASNLDWVTRQVLLERLAKLEVKILTGVNATGMAEGGVTIVDKDGKTHVVAADTLVFALGSTASNRLTSELRGAAPEIYEIGDCARPPGRLAEAIGDGSRVAREL